MNSLTDLLSSCPHIPSETEYWFVRTDGGDYYPGFLQEEVVGLDYGKISLADLQTDLNIQANIDVLKKKVFNAYAEEHGQPGTILAQLLRLKNSMKNGDYVIIPGYGTKVVAIGIIVDDKISESEIVVKSETGEFQKKILKTKKVRWIKRVSRTELHPKLHLSFWSHQAIVDVTKQSEWVDSILYDYYKKGDEYNYVIRVGREGRIPAREIYTALSRIMDIVESVSNEFGLDNDVESMGTSINLNSKGPVRFISLQPSVAIIGLLIIASLGGEIEIDPANMKFRAGVKGTAGDEFV